MSRILVAEVLILVAEVLLYYLFVRVTYVCETTGANFSSKTNCSLSVMILDIGLKMSGLKSRSSFCYFFYDLYFFELSTLASFSSSESSFWLFFLCFLHQQTHNGTPISKRPTGTHTPIAITPEEDKPEL